MQQICLFVLINPLEYNFLSIYWYFFLKFEHSNLDGADEFMFRPQMFANSELFSIFFSRSKPTMPVKGSAC